MLTISFGAMRHPTFAFRFTKSIDTPTRLLVIGPGLRRFKPYVLASEGVAYGPLLQQNLPNLVWSIDAIPELELDAANASKVRVCIT